MAYDNIDHLGAVPAFTPDLKGNIPNPPSTVIQPPVLTFYTDVKIYCWTIDPTHARTMEFTAERDHTGGFQLPNHTNLINVCASYHMLSEVDDIYNQAHAGRLGYLHTLILNGPPTIETVVKAWAESFHKHKLMTLPDGDFTIDEEPRNRFPRHLTGSTEITVFDDIRDPHINPDFFMWPECFGGRELLRNWGETRELWGNQTAAEEFVDCEALDLWKDSDINHWLQLTVLNPDPTSQFIPTLRVILHREKDDARPNSPIPLIEEEADDLAEHFPNCTLSKFIPFRTRAHFENYRNPLLPENRQPSPPIETRKAKKTPGVNTQSRKRRRG